jgi:hypothetical protein
MQLRRGRVLYLVLAALVLLAGCAGSEEILTQNSASPTTSSKLAATPASTAGLLSFIDPKAGSACATLVTPGSGIDSVLAAYESAASKIVDWESRLAGTSAESTSNYSAYAPDKPVSVCLVSGIFRGSVPPPADGSTPRPPANRALFLIPEGGTWVPPVAYGDENTFSNANVPQAG